MAFGTQATVVYNFQSRSWSVLRPLGRPTSFDEPSQPIRDGTANAVMLMLARNSELEGAVSSVRQLEEKFNRRYHYPWVFLNEEPFTEEFKRLVPSIHLR